MSLQEYFKEPFSHIKFYEKGKKFTSFFRKKLWELNNRRCRYCGDYILSHWKMHIDHIIPSSKGGTDDIENLGCSCSACNTAKCNKDLEFLRFCIALRKSNLAGIIIPNQAKRLIEKGIDLKIELKPFLYEVDDGLII